MSEFPNYDLSTSEGGRGYIAHLFKSQINRYDFDAYINEQLAADFACTLARYLDAAQSEVAALRYKAELYDEVWQKATEMGFMNVTMALAELAALREELELLRAQAENDSEANTAIRAERDAMREALDSMTQSRDYCNRVALHNKEQGVELHQRLTAAEQRNADLVELLKDGLDSVYAEARRAENPVAARVHDRLIDRIEAAITHPETVKFLADNPKQVMSAFDAVMSDEWIPPEKVYEELAKDPNKSRRTSPENVADVIETLGQMAAIKPTESGASE